MQRLMPPSIGCEVLATFPDRWAGFTARVLDHDACDGTYLVAFHTLSDQMPMQWLPERCLMRIDLPSGTVLED
jgi:hypothetical protein